MSKAKQRDNLCVFEKHHVIPSSLGGENITDNLVKLSPREHFIAHVLLTKMVVDKLHKRSMSYALIRMQTSNNTNGYSRIGNGKLYEICRKNSIVLISGENNPFYGNTHFSGANNHFYGKTHTDETRKKISLKLVGKMIGANNPFYGKTHTDELKLHISKMQSEPVTIIFEDGREVFFEKRGDIGNYLNISKSMGIQLCTIKRHLWQKYKIKEILYADHVNTKSEI